MAIHALWENYIVKALAIPVALTASADTTGVDLVGLKDDILVVVNVGAVSGTTPTDVISIQTSPDNSVWTTQTSISLASTSGSKVASARVRLPVSHRYIRASEVVAGTTPSFTRSIIALVRAERGAAALNSVTPA